MEQFKTSLVISTYNWPEALELCLKSSLRQTVAPAEILVADDGSDERTAQLIARYPHKNAREYIQYSLRFLFHLTKNLTTHLSHNLCAVLPYLRKMSKFPIDKSTRILYNKNRAMLCKIPYTLSRVVEEQVL